MGVRLDGAFVLEITDLEVKAFDLAIELGRVGMVWRKVYQKKHGERGDLPIKQLSHSSQPFPLGQSELCRSWQ